MTSREKFLSGLTAYFSLIMLLLLFFAGWLVAGAILSWPFLMIGAAIVTENLLVIWFCLLVAVVYWGLLFGLVEAFEPALSASDQAAYYLIMRLYFVLCLPFYLLAFFIGLRS